METIKMKPKSVCVLPDPTVNGQKLTAVCSVTNHGQTMFILKSKGSALDNTYYPISLVKVSKFDESSKLKVAVVSVKKKGKALGNVARHANSITYARFANETKGHLFITTGNPKEKIQVYQTDSSGNVEKELYYYGPNGVKSDISQITYYGKVNGQEVFITNANTKDGRRGYNFTSYDGFCLRFIKRLGYGIDNKSIDYESNDITYQDGKLYHCYFKKIKDRIKNNRIYIYDISNYNVLNGQIMEPIQMIQANADSTYDKKYEIEGVIIRNGTYYTADNIESSNATRNKDAVIKLKQD